MAHEALKERDQRLGSLALRKGRITPLDLEAALQTQKELAQKGEYRPLGTILVESGKLSKEGLEEILGEQTKSWEGQRVVGRYRLVAKIGEGGMGAVWKAVHVDLGNTVAIKLLPYSVVGDERLVQRFQREARLMASINHSNVLQAFDAGEESGQPFFVMPFLEGASVGAIVRQSGRLGPRTTLSIALQIVRGLQYAHSRGMIHRDLKPDNLFIGNDGTAKVLDLGLAKLIEGADGGDQRPTQTGMIVGTPQYMSPEQVRGDPNLDARSDIYSLGATIFHMATGRFPFPGKNVPEVLRQKNQTPTPDPKEVVADIHSGLRRLILSMMAVAPERRPADCTTLEAEIEALLEGKPVTGTSLSPASIVMGQSERDTRTFNLGESRARVPGVTAVVPHVPPQAVGASVTTILPRPPSSSAMPADQKPAESTQNLPKQAAGPDTHTGMRAPAVTPNDLKSAAHEPPRRVQAGFLAQVIAAIILVIVTVLITLAVVRMTSGAGDPHAPRTPAPPVPSAPAH
ncbi:MAG: protein kinase [Planctomycetota bacterium]|nr:protein kinase [Planctomycetota bacterium]